MNWKHIGSFPPPKDKELIIANNKIVLPLFVKAFDNNLWYSSDSNQSYTKIDFPYWAEVEPPKELGL